MGLWKLEKGGRQTRAPGALALAGSQRGPRAQPGRAHPSLEPRGLARPAALTCSAWAQRGRNYTRRDPLVGGGEGGGESRCESSDALPRRTAELQEAGFHRTARPLGGPSGGHWTESGKNACSCFRAAGRVRRASQVYRLM